MQRVSFKSDPKEQGKVTQRLRKKWQNKGLLLGLLLWTAWILLRRTCWHFSGIESHRKDLIKFIVQSFKPPWFKGVLGQKANRKRHMIPTTEAGREHSCLWTAPSERWKQKWYVPPVGDEVRRGNNLDPVYDKIWGIQEPIIHLAPFPPLFSQWPPPPKFPAFLLKWYKQSPHP